MTQERSIRFSVDSTGARRGSREVSRSLDDIRRAAGQADRAVEGVEDGFGSLRRASTLLTGALGLVGVAASGISFGLVIRETLEWERALTNLAKTVDAPQKRLDELADTFVRMSEEIPIASGELADLGASAGQLGIATQNIEGFVEVMAALGVSTNLSTEEAATSFARFANIVQMPQTQFDQLGAVVVDLGNNLATTEAEIVAFGTRMAGAGAIAGLTEANVMAIGAAMSSVGVEAEAGGTAVQKVLIDMNTAVAQGNDNLAVFARVAGVSAADFAAAWKDDAGAAFTAFVEGVGRAGDNATTVLEELGLTDQRLTRAFLSLGGAGDLLRRSIELGNDAWVENTALTDEAAKFYATLGASIETLKNQLSNMAASLGEDATPALRAAVQATSDLLRVSGDLAKAGVAGALIGISVAAGKSTVAFIANTTAALADARAQVAVQRANVAGAVAQLQMARATSAATGSMAAQSAAATVLRGHVEALNAATARASLGALAAGAASRGFAAALGFIASPIGVAITTAGILAAVFVRMGNDAREAARGVDELKASIVGLSETELLVKQADIDRQIFELERQMSGVSRTRTQTTSGGTGGRGVTVTSANPEYTALVAQMDGLKQETALVEQGLEALAAAAADTGDSVSDQADAIADATGKLTDYQKALAAINAELRTMAMNHRFGIGFPDISDPLNDLIAPPGSTRGRDAAGRPGQVSETLVQNPDVKQASIDAAIWRELLRKHADADKAGDSLVRTASDVSRGVIDVADAFGGLDDATRRALSGITGLIGALDGFEKGAGFSLANIGSIVGMVGAVAQIGAGLFAESPAEQERNRILRDNNLALERLRAGLEGLRITFGDMATASGALRGAADKHNLDKMKPAFLDLFFENRGIDLTSAKVLEMAKERGITLTDSDGFLIEDSVRVLVRALEHARESVESFGDSLEGQRAITDAYNEIFDVTDPAKLLESQVGLLAQQAGNLFGGFAGMDFSNADNRELLEAALRDLVTRVGSGDLSADDLAGFSSVQEFLDALTGVDRGLDAFAKGLDEATRATTDIPKAINLALYQQRYATGLNGPAVPGGPLDTSPLIPGGSAPITGQAYPGGGANFYITIQGSNLTGEQLLDEVERAAQRRVGSGGEVVLR